MTIQQVIDKIIAYHPPLGEREATTCDTVKFGDTSIPCTGIATAIYPSPDIIRAAAKAGCNLLVVHEPSFYSHMDPLDWLADACGVVCAVAAVPWLLGKMLAKSTDTKNC